MDNILRVNFSTFTLILGAFLLLHLLTPTRAVFFGGRPDPACHGGVNLTRPRGRIREPYLLGPDLNKRLCVWHVVAPIGQVIFFRFSSFDIGLNEDKDYCRKSILRANVGQRWLQFCGVRPNSTGYVTSSNKLIVRLEHGGARNLRRPVFTIQYQMFNSSDRSSRNLPTRRNVAAARSHSTRENCDGNRRITLRDGETYRLELTKRQYDNNCNMMWRFDAPEYRVIEMNVEDGSIEYGWMCAFDRLLVYGCRTQNCQQEPANACHLLGCLCGNITSRTLRSNGNQLSLNFQTDHSETDNGFKITLTVYEAPEIIVEEPEELVDVTCGLHGLPVAASRITGGQDVPPRGLPWQVELTYGPHHVHLCGGTLLSSSWVITAAHCVYGLSNPEKLVVKAGDHRRGDGDADEVEQRQPVRNVFVHCDYDAVTYNNDVAILELANPFNYNSDTRPVCLPYRSDIEVGKSCHISGWGDTREGGLLSHTLKYGTVRVISNDDCKDMFASKGYSVEVTNNQLCAVGLKSPGFLRDDACQGDSGGPMSEVVTSLCTRLFGMVSWGIGCARDGNPGVYTRLFPYLDWIRDVTKGHIYQLESGHHCDGRQQN